MVLMGVAHSKGNYQIACMSEGCRLLNTNIGVGKMLLPPEKNHLMFLFILWVKKQISNNSTTLLWVWCPSGKIYPCVDLSGKGRSR